jgi:CBS domain-containing protein
MNESVDADQPDPDPGAGAVPRLVGDVMGPAVTVSKDTPLRDLARLMLERQVQSVLVVDERSQAVGTLSERNLTLDARCLRLASLAPQPVTAVQVMERSFDTATDQEPLERVVERMLRRESEQVVIVHGDRVLGVLDRHDLLRHFAGAVAPGHRMAVARANGQPIRTAASRRASSAMRWLVAAWR